MRAFNGDVRLTLAERPADARILALALNGTIKSDIPLTLRETWGPRWGETTLGKGEPVISLDVVTGHGRDQELPDAGSACCRSRYFLFSLRCASL